MIKYPSDHINIHEYLTMMVMIPIMSWCSPFQRISVGKMLVDPLNDDEEYIVDVCIPDDRKQLYLNQCASSKGANPSTPTTGYIISRFKGRAWVATELIGFFNSFAQVCSDNKIQKVLRCDSENVVVDKFIIGNNPITTHK